MGCSCSGGPTPQVGAAQSFIDLGNACPQDPQDVLAYATLNALTGSYYRSSNYVQPSGSSVWIASPIAVSAAPVVTANGTDNLQTVADANQWNFSHLTASIAATTAPPIRRMLFFRAGVAWVNTVIFTLPSSPAFTEFQLSMLENAATRGDAQGTVPTIRFSSGPYSSTMGLGLTFRAPGRYCFGLLGINNNSTPDYSMFELDAIVVP